jgi:hypothetical protein
MQIARDVIDTFDIIITLLENMLKRLPMVETYIDIFGASNIQLLRVPLVNLYSKLIEFGIQVVKLFDGWTVRECPICQG